MSHNRAKLEPSSNAHSKQRNNTNFPLKFHDSDETMGEILGFQNPYDSDEQPGSSRPQEHQKSISGEELIQSFVVQIPDSPEESKDDSSIQMGPLPDCPGHLNVSMGQSQDEALATIRRVESIIEPGSRVSKYERAGLRGLINIGNTCFMNSILQCLSNTGPLLRYILFDKFVGEVNTTGTPLNGALLAAYVKLIKGIWGPGTTAIDTTGLKSKLEVFAPRFCGFRQHDSQELLRFLLDGLHQELNRIQIKPDYVKFEGNEEWNLAEHSFNAWKNYVRIDNSQIVDVFVGQLKSTLTCSACYHTSVTFDPFWDLSISIPKAQLGQTVTLEQCLASFTKEETLSGDEKVFCSQCKTHQKATKKFTIERFPEVLVIHLKRFKGDEKLKTVVRFPLHGLDIGPYSSSQTRCCSYNLYGISNHSGNVSAGHYIAYCKHPYNNSWSIYDDKSVQSTSSQIVKEVEAYVLFYEMSEGSKSVLF